MVRMNWNDKQVRYWVHVNNGGSEQRKNNNHKKISIAEEKKEISGPTYSF